eukprot:6487141-Amphidinium_carterae.1
MVPRGYWDNALLKHSAYVDFLREMECRGLIEYMLVEHAVERIGIFFVKKKGGMIRMVADCRRSNEYFREPHGVELASGESLGALEIESHHGPS